MEMMFMKRSCVFFTRARHHDYLVCFCMLFCVSCFCLKRSCVSKMRMMFMKKGCVFFTRARQTPSSFSPPLVTKVMRASNRSAFELYCIVLYCIVFFVLYLYCIVTTLHLNTRRMKYLEYKSHLQTISFSQPKVNI